MIKRTTRCAALLAAGTLTVSFAACGDDDGGGTADPTAMTDGSATVETTEPDTTTETAAPDTVAAPPETTGPTPTTESTPTIESASGEAVDDVCALVPEDLVAQVFRAGNAEAESNDYGAGTAECSWEDETSELLVSVVPFGNLQTDYIDQLVEGPAVDSAVLGDDAIGFAGLVGIGQASSRGTSVAFGSGDIGFIVAVRTGDDGSPAVDLPIAIEIAEAIAQR